MVDAIQDALSGLDFGKEISPAMGPGSIDLDATAAPNSYKILEHQMSCTPMFRSTIEEEQKAWFSYEKITLAHHYGLLQRRIIDGYDRYRYLVERYSNIVNTSIDPVTEVDPKLVERNVMLLKNAIELWITASRSSEAVKPVLYHYSWHCFNSFFAYMFFKWKPEHAAGHGIKISNWSDDVAKIEVKFSGKGLFQRFVDTWTLLGASVAFSRFLPVFKGDEIEFVKNERCWIGESDCLSVQQLLSLESEAFDRDIRSEQAWNFVAWDLHPHDRSIDLPTDALKNYVIFFVASSLARYRPTIWNSVVRGEGEAQAIFMVAWSYALMDYTLGRLEHGEPIRRSVLDQISSLLGQMERKEFVLKKGTY